MNDYVESMMNTSRMKTNDSMMDEMKYESDKLIGYVQSFHNNDGLTL